MTDEPELLEPLESQPNSLEVAPRQFFQIFQADAARAFSPALPDTLFHYTSAIGLIGMVKNHCLWFSDARFLNDGSETGHGVGVASRAVAILSDRYPHIHAAIAEHLRDAIVKVATYYQPVVFCMSEADNLLNQWRDYGKDIVPYCVEFRTGELIEWKHFSFPIMLCKIEYDGDRQIEMMLALLTRIYDEMAVLLASGKLQDEHKESIFLRAAQEIVWFIPRFKNLAFSAEREWRMISFQPDINTARSYRPSSLGVVPYYEWRRQQGGNLPIAHVTVGPSPYSQVSDMALKMLLEDNNYPVETSYSTIPIRR